MAQVIENNDIDFSKVSLGIPNQLQSNSFFSKIYFNNNPFIIQAPQCITLSGIKKYKNKIISELIFTNDTENANLFYNFFTELENNIKKSLLANKDDWFEDDITIDDIEDSFQSSLLFHDKGIKIKAHIQQNNLDNTIKFNCYDINHNIISNDSFKSGVSFIPIFEIVGCKFSNKLFTIEIKLLQSLILNSIIDNSKPLFSNNTKISNVSHNIDISENDQNISNSNIDNDDNVNTNSAVDANSDLDNSMNLDTNIDVDNSMNVDTNSDVDNSINVNTNNNIDTDSQVNTNNYDETTIDKNNELDNLDKSIDNESDNESQIRLNDNDYDVDNTNKSIEEVSLDLEYLDNNPVKLKTHADIYYEIWKLYKDEAYKHRRQNLKTYLNSRNIISNILINEL